MAVIGDTGATAYLVSAMEGVTVADTSEQDTEEPCRKPAWGAVNKFVLERDQSLSLRPVVHRPSQDSDHGRGNPSSENHQRHPHGGCYGPTWSVCSRSLGRG